MGSLVSKLTTSSSRGRRHSLVTDRRFTINDKLNEHDRQAIPVGGPPHDGKESWADCRSTGVTGYIAGDALSTIYAKHPDFEYAALVRTEEKASLVRKAYPSIRIVLGGLDDSDLLKREAAEADIVLRMDTSTRRASLSILTCPRRCRCF